MYSGRVERAYIATSEDMMKLLLTILTILALIGSVAATVPTLCANVNTLAVDNITPDSAGFYGDYTGTLPADVWFMYGGKTNTYPYTTDKVNLTTGMNFSAVGDSGFYSNRTLYVRAMSTCGAGPEVNFKVSNVTPLQNTNFGLVMEVMIFESADPSPHAGNGTGDEANISAEAAATGPFDPLLLMQELPKAYYMSFGATESLGLTLFWGFVFLIIFMVLYLRSENITAPALLGMVIGWCVMSYVPGEFAQAGQALLVIAIGAMGFILIKGRVR